MGREHALKMLIDKGALWPVAEIYNVGNGTVNETAKELRGIYNSFAGYLIDWDFICSYKNVEVYIGRFNKKQEKYIFTWNEIAKEILKRNVGIEQLSLFQREG